MRAEMNVVRKLGCSGHGVFTPFHAVTPRMGTAVGAALLFATMAGAQTTVTASAPVLEPPTSYLSLQTDPENCLLCHRFRGLSRLDTATGEMRLFFCSVEYFTERQGAHARLRCTSCHRSDEVLVVPHQVRTPVDCTQTCHIVPSSGVELQFSHQRVADALDRSAHGAARLRDLPFDPPLLRPGQSNCLYCHDEPVFQDVSQLARPIGQGGLTTRCEMCHGEGMPADVKYYAEHIGARLRPSRPMRQLAQVCAVCHSDPKVIAQIGSHDAVASYLHSFHGKANLLGSTETANCLDCHASQEGDVHAMLLKTDPESSINEGRLPSTCRTTQCHPGAPPGMSEAAVHLNLDPQARTPEFYVAAMFVSLTAVVMIIFFVMIMLELLNIVVRRRDPHHEALVRTARKLLEIPEARRLLMRMTPHQRVQHWMLAVFFTALVVTGMPIKFADAQWAERVIAPMGGLATARFLHRVCGVVLMAAFAYHLVYLLFAFIRRVRESRARGEREPIWKMLLFSPMMLTPQDFKQFGELFGYLLFLRRERPRFGHYNFMQKFEYWAVFWGMPVMGLSGLALWGTQDISEFVSGRILNFAFIIHSDEAYLAFIYIAVVHIFSVILAPAVFPVSPGTVTGDVPAAELVEGHRGEIEDLAARFKVAPDPAPVVSWTPGLIAQTVLRRIYAVGLFCFCALVCFVSIRFLFGVLFSHQTAPIEIVEIPRRLDARLLAVTSQAPGGHESGELRPRGPLAHFHLIPNWFQADPGNGCTTSGCHAPLPHARRVEVRAFLNMHATFVDCMVCHAEDASRYETARWLGLPERQPRSTPPAVLQIADVFDKTTTIEAGQEQALHSRLLVLLGEAIEDSGENRQLREWRLRLDTSYVGSRAWRSVIDDMRVGIRLHVHGEYNAKIALFHDDELLRSTTPENLAATREYLAARASPAAPEGRKLLDKVHKGVRPAGALCAPCHSASPTLIDFEKLGYPASRIEALQSSLTVDRVLRIEKGQPFHMPRIAEERNAP